MTPQRGVDATTGNAIGLCMVVKNEAEYLEGCLKHIAPYAAELIVVDTGSSDDSPAIAERCGARVYSFPWTNDFSEARNFSLQQATAPWILVLDADERLATRDAGRLAHLVQSAPEASAFSLLQRSYLKKSGQLSWDQSWQPNTFEYEESKGYAGYIDIAVARLFRRNPQIRFVGCVHENIEGSLAAGGIALKPAGLVLHHFGQVRDITRMQQKMSLYLELGVKKLKEEPNAARAHFELGIQYQSLKRYSDAIPHFRVAVEQDASFAIAELYAGICYSRLEQHEQASWHLERARRSIPSSSELECELGLIDLRRGKFELAGSWFERALKRQPKHVASLSYLGAVKANLGRLDEGIALLEKALELDPNHCDS